MISYSLCLHNQYNDDIKHIHWSIAHNPFSLYEYIYEKSMNIDSIKIEKMMSWDVQYDYQSIQIL